MASVFEHPSYLWQQAVRRHRWRAERHPMRECDLVVVGAGGTGISAGLAAAQTGQSVVIFEAQPQPGGLFAQNAGVVQDGFEGDLEKLEQRQRSDSGMAMALLRESHAGLQTVRELAQLAGTTFDETGYLIALRTQAQYDAHKKYISRLQTQLPDIYKPDDFEDVDAKEIIGGDYYEYGGFWSRHGGVVNSPELIFGLIDHMVARRYNVQLCTSTTVKEFEPAPNRGVRFYHESRGRLGEVVARRAIITANAGSLIPGFQPSELSSTGMFAIKDLPEAIIQKVAQSRFGGVPHIGPEKIMPPYYRFIDDEHGLTLLFGGSGRVGQHEDRGISGESLTMRDVERVMLRIMPELAGVAPAAQWARYLSFSPHDVPVMFGYDPATLKFIRFEDLSAPGRYGPPHIPVIYIGELGGQGNVFALHLGKMAGRYNDIDFERLKIFDRFNPQKPAPRQHLQRRAAKERRDLRRN